MKPCQKCINQNSKPFAFPKHDMLGFEPSIATPSGETIQVYKCSLCGSLMENSEEEGWVLVPPLIGS
jgi:hypothetical protein